jgi:hypothetical protein
MEEQDGQVYIKNNGVWTNTTNNIPELVATYLKIWLEDAVPSDLLESMETTKNQYTVEKQKLAVEKVYGDLVDIRTQELKITLEKLEDSLKEKENV